jgi:hypothetical protein
VASSDHATRSEEQKVADCPRPETIHFVGCIEGLGVEHKRIDVGPALEVVVLGAGRGVQPFGGQAAGVDLDIDASERSVD